MSDNAVISHRLSENENNCIEIHYLTGIKNNYPVLIIRVCPGSLWLITSVPVYSTPGISLSKTPLLTILV